MQPPWIIGFGLCTAMSVSAQGDGLREENDAFGGRVKFDVDHEDRLIVDHHDGTGHYRQDVAYIEFLDPKSITWSAEEGAILLRCLPGQEQCIDKEIFKLNTIRPTSRMNLPFAGDPASREKTMTVLAAWIALEQERIAKAASETNTRPKRKK